jgi:hypothetical protein
MGDEPKAELKAVQKFGVIATPGGSLVLEMEFRDGTKLNAAFPVQVGDHIVHGFRVAMKTAEQVATLISEDPAGNA